MKKVLSFVLILALVLGSFSFAFGLTDVTDADANSEAITVANNLGIVTGYEDGSFKPGQDVNRAEFAAMITRALAVPESALAGFSATNFKDTAGYGWAVKYLAFCESKGIMIGDGQGNVMPGRTINVNEAMTMVLRTLGYTENSALLVGTWPSKYVTLAQDLNLYDDMASAVMVDRANAAQVIYNALTIDKVQVDADGATTPIGGGGVTMLTAGLNSQLYTPTGGAAGDAWVVLGDEASVINLQKYAGAYVTAYANSDKEIIAVDEVKSTFITGSFDKAAGVVAAGDMFTADDDTEYTVNRYAYSSEVSGAVEAVVQFQNGDDLAIAAPGTFAANATVTIAADISGKKINQLYSVNEWTKDAEFQWETDMLDEEDNTIDGHQFEETDNDTIDYGTFELLGVAKLGDIAEDAVVTVYEDVANAFVTKVMVGTEVVTGQVTKLVAGEYTINGSAYELSSLIPVADIPSVGDEGTAYLDYDGNIAFFDVDDAASGNFAVLIGVETATKFGKASAEVNLITSVGDDITVDVEEGAAVAAATALVGVNAAAPAVDPTINMIVEYSLNSKGEVESITDVSTPAPGVTNLTANRSLLGTDRVDTGMVVFVKDGTDYSVESVSGIETDTTINPLAHVKDATSSKITALLLDNADMDSGDLNYGVINAITTEVNSDGDTKVGIEGFNGKVAINLVTNKNLSAPGVPVATNILGTSVLQVLTIDDSDVVTATANVASPATLDQAVVYDAVNAVAKIDGKFIKMAVTNNEYLLSDDVVIYLWNSTDSKWEVKTSLTVLKGKKVQLYETEDGTVDNVFNYVMAW